MRIRGLALLGLLITVAAISSFAVTPQFWENFTQEDLLEGTLTKVSLAPDGKLFLAPTYDSIYDTGQPYIFSMARDKSGNVYVGTGHEGKVFKIDPSGKGTLYYQAKELDVFALALDSSDTLYVGTSPDGRVYKVTGPNQATEFCNPEDKYVWSMLFDQEGNLYVGTGTRGRIIKVDRGGKKTDFYTCSDNNAVALLRTADGKLLAGTSPQGRVIEISPDGKGFTLLDTALEEVRALAVDRFGTIYAVASSAKGLAPATPAAKPEMTGTTTPTTFSVTSFSSLVGPADKSKDTSSVTAPGGEKDSTGSLSSIYSITRDGSVETLYSSRDQMVYDILARPDGSVLAATGPKGRLISIDSAKQVTILSDSPEEDATRLVALGDVVYVAASNQGKLYKLQPRQAESGTYESMVEDAKTVASWGKVSWKVVNPSGGAIELSTRTGNTEKPDKSWSEWTPAYSTSAGQQITSPKARYLQWRATLKRSSGSSSQIGSADLLDAIRIAYLQQNLRPQVVSINVLPYGLALQKNPPLPAGTLSYMTATSAASGLSLNSPRTRGKDSQPLAPRQVLQQGSQSFTWKATDDNDDDLEYSLYFRGEGEVDWKLLEKGITDGFYTLNSASLPDGVYRLKVVASDALSNPYGKFLIGELVSDPFVVTNTTPLVEIKEQKTTGRKVDVQFRARVPMGRLETAEFSVDGSEWFLLFPVDGISDSPQEDYQFTTPDLSPGEHLIGIRASDLDGNTGTAKIVVKVQ